MTIYLRLLSAVLTVAACSPAPVPISQSPRDPTSPSAPEGIEPTSAVRVAAAPVSPPAPAGHQHHAPAPDPHSAHRTEAEPTSTGDAGAESAYTCPMHPEVSSDRPGVCSKCNMKLVPKK